MRVFITIIAGICLVFAAMSPISLGSHSGPISLETIGRMIFF